MFERYNHLSIFIMILLAIFLPSSLSGRQTVNYKEQFNNKEGWTPQGALAEYKKNIGFLAPGCIKLSNNATGKSSSWTSPAIKLKPGTYKVSVWCAKNFLHSPDHTFGARFSVICKGKGKSSSHTLLHLHGVAPYARQMISPKGIQWKYYERLVKVEPDADAIQLSLIFGNPSQTKGEVWLDDVLISRENETQTEKASSATQQKQYRMLLNTPVECNLFTLKEPLQFDIVVADEKKTPEIRKGSKLRSTVKDCLGVVHWRGELPVMNAKTIKLPGAKCYEKYRNNLFFSVNLPALLEKSWGQPMILEAELISPQGKLLCRATQDFGILKIPPKPSPELAEKSHFGNMPRKRDGGLAPRYGKHNIPTVWGKIRPSIRDILGFYWIRDCYVNWWSRMQPQKDGPIDFTKCRLGRLVKHQFLNKYPDPYYNMYACFNVERDYLAPKWAQKATYPNLHAAVRLEELGKFYYRFIDHFKDYNKYWALGNELPIEKNTIDIARIGYLAAKKADPQCKVIAPSSTGFGPDEHEAIVKLGLLDWCDILDLHNYFGLDHFKASLKAISRLMRKEKKIRKIWSTELGLSSGPILYQASELIKSHAACLAYGVDKIFWFCIGPFNENTPRAQRFSVLFNRTFNDKPKISLDGITKTYGISPRPLLFSYYHVLRHFNFADFARDISDRKNKLEGYLFNDRGQSTAAVWRRKSRQKYQTFMLKDTGPYIVTDFLGRSTAITPVNGVSLLTLGENALMFRFPKKIKDLKFIPAPVKTPPSESRACRGQDLQLSFSVDKVFGEAFKGNISLLLDEAWKVSPKNSPVTADKKAEIQLTVPKKFEKQNMLVHARLTDLKGNVVGLLDNDLIITPKVKTFFSPVRHAASGKNGLTLDLENLSSGPLPLTLIVSNPLAAKMRPEILTLSVTLKPNEKKGIDIPLKQAINQNVFYDFKVEVLDKNGKKIAEKCQQVGFQLCTFSAKPKVIDGDLADWDLSRPFTMYGFTAVKNKPYFAWGGTGDLSGKYWLEWDEKHLYIAVEVIDDEHFNNKNKSDIWNGDAIQVGVVPYNKGNDQPFGYYRDAFALLNDGKPCFWRHGAHTGAKGKVDAVQYMIKRTGKKTIYEIAYPKSTIQPVILKAGSTIRFSLLVMEDEKKVNKLRINRWIECFPGISYTEGWTADYPIVHLVK